MELDQVRSLKQECSAGIHKLLEGFMNQTGVAITSVDVRIAEAPTLGNVAPSTVITGVKISLEI